MITEDIIIDEELCNKIQRYNIERDARKDIITYILQNDLNIPQERFDKYQAEYEEKFLLFDQAKKELETKYILPIVDLKIQRYNWNLNYSDRILHIEIIDKK